MSIIKTALVLETVQEYVRGVFVLDIFFGIKCEFFGVKKLAILETSESGRRRLYSNSFFFYQGFLSQTLKTHRTAGKGRGPSFIPLYLFHALTNIQTFICNFAREMTITYF